MLNLRQWKLRMHRKTIVYLSAWQLGTKYQRMK